MNKQKIGPVSMKRPPEVKSLIAKLRDPEVEKSLARFKAKYRKHAVPLPQLREELDAALGDIKLSDILHEVRE
jgi:hypothetical protein